MDYKDNIIYILRKLCSNTEPGKKVVQKIMYLIERRGVDLNLNFKIHFYGPYSSELDDLLRYYEAMDIININTEKRTHLISIKDYNQVKSVEGNFTEVDRKKIDFVVKHFSNQPAQVLEAYATLDYVSQVLKSNGIGDEEEIINKVIEIKGSKYNKDILFKYLHELKELGYN